MSYLLSCSTKQHTDAGFIPTGLPSSQLKGEWDPDISPFAHNKYYILSNATLLVILTKITVCR